MAGKETAMQGTRPGPGKDGILSLLLLPFKCRCCASLGTGPACPRLGDSVWSLGLLPSSPEAPLAGAPAHLLSSCSLLDGSISRHL